MPSPTYYSILTTAGLTKIADAIANATPISITQMALGDGNGSTPTPSAGQTALVHQVYKEPLSQLITDPDNPAYAIAELIVPAEDGPFTVREIGLYDSTNTLIAVGNFPTTYKPVASEGSVRDLVIRMIIDVENATAVTLSIDPSVVLASQEYVQNYVKNNFSQNDGKYIATEKIRARDGDGLFLQDDGGNGIFIKDGGNVGFGTSNPTARTHVSLSSSSATFLGMLLTNTHSNGFGLGLGFEVSPTAGTYLAGLVTAENTNGTSNDGGKLKFYTAAPDASHTLTQRAVLDDSGNLGLGTTGPGYKLHVVDASSSSSTNAGINIQHTLNARIRFVTTTQNVRYYVGLSDTSTALEFRDDNGVTRLTLAQGGDLRPGVDDAQDVGHSSFRWDDVYATNGTIQTSDERLKTAIADCPLGLNFIKALRAVSYKWADREAQTATQMVQKTQIIQKEVEQSEVVEIDGKYVLSVTTVTKDVEEPVFEDKPLYDEDGNLVYKSIQKTELVQKEFKTFEVVEVEGKFVRQETTVTREVIEPIFENHQLYDSDNNPVLDEEGNPVFYQIPVMESVQVFHRVPVMEEQEYEVGIAKSFSRRHFGLIAQEVLQVLQDQEIETADFAPLTYDEESDRYGMRYTELVGILIKAIQELSTRVEALET